MTDIAMNLDHSFDLGSIWGLLIKMVPRNCQFGEINHSGLLYSFMLGQLLLRDPLIILRLQLTEEVMHYSFSGVPLGREAP